MHASSMLRMAWFVEQYANRIEQGDKKIAVLDVGSYDVNGSYKVLFDSNRYEYTGLDMVSGPNVDIVAENPYAWRNLDNDSFDIVVSGQAFEHVEFFWITMSEMTRVLRKHGLICIIAPHGFGEHRYPVDCYRFFTDGMISLARYVNLKPLHAHTNCGPKGDERSWRSHDKADSILIAEKPYEGRTRIVDLDSYECVPVNQAVFRGDLIPYKPSVYKRLLFWLLNKVP